MFKARKVAEAKGLNPNIWASITETLPLVTGAHSRETIGYVRKIEKIKEVLH